MTYRNGGGASIGGLTDGDTYFVILDDSVQVFDPANAVTGNYIDFGSSHGLSTGDEVVYRNGGGDNIGGLEDGKVYNVLVVNATAIALTDDSGNVIGLTGSDATGTAHSIDTNPDDFSLAASYQDAINGVAIDINGSAATGSNHRFQTLLASATSNSSTQVSNNNATGQVTTAIQSTIVPTGTVAFIGDATVSAGGDVNVRAKDNLEFNGIAGSVSGGLAGIGAGIGIANIQTITDAHIDNGAVITVGSTINDEILVHSQYTAQMEILAFVGAAGGGTGCTGGHPQRFQRTEGLH